MGIPNIVWNGKVVMEESEVETSLTVPLVVLVLNRKIPR